MRGLRRLVAVGALALLATGCSNLHGSHAQRVGEWASSANYASNAAQITSDLGFISRATAAHNLRALRTDCGGLGDDVETIYESLPTPDATLSNDLAEASAQLASSASACFAASSFNSADYRSSRRELAAGTAAFDAANKRLRQLGVR